MSIQKKRMLWNRADLGPPSPLPRFSLEGPNLEVPFDGTLKEDDLLRLGEGLAPDYLPYPSRELYNRRLRPQEITVITLENDSLKALFFPSLGGRLMSLYSKTEERELLFVNKDMYFANLGISNAWFSGGIEWNIGRRGHSCHACSPVFAGIISGPWGDKGLRIFDLERQSGLFWQIDFFLPPHSPCLLSRVKVVNPHPYEKALYYWTNTALPQEETTRVFSSTKDVLYLNHAIQGLSRGSFPRVQGKDRSYCRNNISSASEYYFQPSPEDPLWEAAVNKRGEGFFESSTNVLSRRKAFIWGQHQGGKNWQRHLCAGENPEYLEIQAGVSKTQFHSRGIAGGEVLSWVQAFGPLQVEASAAGGDWDQGAARCQARIHGIISPAQAEAFLKEGEAGGEAPVEEILFSGEGWGALEIKRLPPRKVLASFSFPSDSLGEAQRPWMELLEGRYKGGGSLTDWMTQREWREILLAQKKLIPSPFILFHLGILHLSVSPGLPSMRDSAKAYFLQVFEQTAAGEAAWCLMETARQEKDYSLAWKYGRILLNQTGLSRAALLLVVEAVLTVLVQAGQYKEAQRVYRSQPEEIQEHEKIRWAFAPAALARGCRSWLEDYFAVSAFPYIREGDGHLEELWHDYQGGRALPKGLDFRVFVPPTAGSLSGASRIT